MLSERAFELVMATADQYRRESFLASYTDEELTEAADWYRVNRPGASKKRREKIGIELDRRKKEESTVYKSKIEREGFIQAWNEVCMSIYQRIQFMPAIPLVKR